MRKDGRVVSWEGLSVVLGSSRTIRPTASGVGSVTCPRAANLILYHNLAFLVHSGTQRCQARALVFPVGIGRR